MNQLPTDASLKDIDAHMKEMRKRQKELKAKDNANKDERKNLRTSIATSRKNVYSSRKTLRDAVASVYESLRGDEATDMRKLADQIVNDAAILSKNLQDFADAQDRLAGLTL